MLGAPQMFTLRNALICVMLARFPPLASLRPRVFVPVNSSAGFILYSTGEWLDLPSQLLVYLPDAVGLCDK